MIYTSIGIPERIRKLDLAAEKIAEIKDIIVDIQAARRHDVQFTQAQLAAYRTAAQALRNETVTLLNEAVP